MGYFTMARTGGFERREYFGDLAIYNSEVIRVEWIQLYSIGKIERGFFTIIQIIHQWFTKKGPNWLNIPLISRLSQRETHHETKKPNPFKSFYYYIFLGIAAFMLVITTGLTVRHNKWMVKEVANVHYMDSVGSNFLFRGALPLTRNPPAFNYDGLKLAIINAGKRAGVKVPSQFYLIDVNFLNIENPVDARWISVEQQFFQRKPTLGRIQVWGMNGTGLHATDPALAANRSYLARNLDDWLNDRLARRVEILRRWLDGSTPVVPGKAKIPVVIYIHCVAGCDRTGEFSGAYYLRYLNKSWEEVNAMNRSMCRRNRPFGCKNYRAVQWYCLWLNLERGFTLNWWKDFACSGK
jgi:hypothetical protein